MLKQIWRSNDFSGEKTKSWVRGREVSWKTFASKTGKGQNIAQRKVKKEAQERRQVENA